MKKSNKENVQDGLNKVYKTIGNIRNMSKDSAEYEAIVKHLKELGLPTTEKDVILHMITYELENINLRCNIPFED